MFVRRVALAAVLMFGMTAGSAQAGMITLNYDFTASGFPTGFPDPVTLSFSLTFDNSSAFVDEPIDTPNFLTLSVPYSGTAQFTYFSDTDQLFIGAGTSATALTTSADDFRIQMNSVSTNPTLFTFYISNSSEIGLAGTVTGGPTQAAVPEPATLSLLGIGLAGAGLRRWRQRRSS